MKLTLIILGSTLWIWMGYKAWIQELSNNKQEDIKLTDLLMLIISIICAPITFIIFCGKDITICSRPLTKSEKLELVKNKLNK